MVVQVIELFTGTPGSGKSYSALARALAMENRKKLIVANFAVSRPPKNWAFVPDEHLTVNKLVELSRGLKPGESRALLIIDECGRLFNSRDWLKGGDDRMGWITFFSQHRKLGFDVILIVQNDMMIDKQIRAMVEQEVKYHKANRLFPFSYIPFFSFFFSATSWYHTKMRSTVRITMLKPWVAGRYDHMALFDQKSREALFTSLEGSARAGRAEGRRGTSGPGARPRRVEVLQDVELPPLAGEQDGEVAL